MTHFQLAPRFCRHCGAYQAACSVVYGDHHPREGDVGICRACGVMEIHERGDWRLMEMEDIRALPFPTLQALVRLEQARRLLVMASPPDSASPDHR